MKNWHHLLPSLLKSLEVFRVRPLFDPHPLEVASFLPKVMLVAFHQSQAKECSVLAPVGSDRELRKLVFHVPEPKGSNGGGNKSQCVCKGDLVALQLSAVFQRVTLCRDMTHVWEEGTSVTPPREGRGKERPGGQTAVRSSPPPLCRSPKSPQQPHPWASLPHPRSAPTSQAAIFVPHSPQWFRTWLGPVAHPGPGLVGRLMD